MTIPNENDRLLARIAAFAMAGVLALSAVSTTAVSGEARPRARDLGVAPGIFAPGPANAITDVAGVRVGQVTLIEGDAVRTGVTAVLPHGGDLFRSRVPAALHVGNGFGKLVGVTQLRELGELETPILLTCTLCVWQAADAMVEWLLARPGMADVRSINPVVGETNDGGLNDIRRRPVTREAVWRALETASTGPVAEGSVGAGTGTEALGWKGGIGTASRRLPASAGGWTVGVLVQSNFGGVLQILGAPVGKALGRYAFRELAATDAGAQAPATPPAGRSQAPGLGVEAAKGHDPAHADARHGTGPRQDQDDGRTHPDGDGSIMIVIATDAPLGARNLERVAARAMLGLARTGSSASNGSGDYAIAFSTAPSVRRAAGAVSHRVEELANPQTSALFQATVESVEEAIYNSLFRATTVTGNGRRVEALPIDRVRAILERHGISANGKQPAGSE